MRRQPASGPVWGACGAPQCSAKLRYLPVAGGAQVPCDVTSEPDGPLVPRTANDGARYLAAREELDGDRPGYVPHWQSCPDPAFWAAERRRVLDAATGKVADAAGPAGPRSLELGPCAGCRRPDHVAYGPHCRGTLCAACATILAAWRATPQDRRTPLVYPPWKDGAS